MGDDHSIANPFQVWKKRFKKSICAAVILLLLGPALLAVGIALLVEFTDFWGDKEEDLKRSLAYTGVALLLLGLLVLIIGIIIVVTLVCIYKRINRSATQQGFKPPAPGQYGPGKAPYPVQKGWTTQGIPGIVSHPQPNAPLVQDETKHVHAEDVHVEITPSETKF